jgi:hypothetical protein
MRWLTHIPLIVWIAMPWAHSPSSQAAERRATPVPPTLEIEVLDPGVDPLGNPAVIVTPGPLGHPLQIDIPPTVLVHRYYYTGDRSFQAQMLPGGPSILVVHHPKTGERCYVEAQMLPGAPRVTYTAHSIEYDYGENGITLHFGLFGAPTVKYRSGLAWSTKVRNLVHADPIAARTRQAAARSRALTSTSHTTLKAAAIQGGEAVKTVTLPVQNLLRIMPFGAALSDPDRHLVREQRVAEHQRQRELQHAELEIRRREQTMATIR